MCSQSACQRVLVYSFRVLKCSGWIIRINEISFNCSDTIVLTCLENSGWSLCGSGRDCNHGWCFTFGMFYTGINNSGSQLTGVNGVIIHLPRHSRKLLNQPLFISQTYVNTEKKIYRYYIVWIFLGITMNEKYEMCLELPPWLHDLLEILIPNLYSSLEVNKSWSEGVYKVPLWLCGTRSPAGVSAHVRPLAAESLLALCCYGALDSPCSVGGQSVCSLAVTSCLGISYSGEWLWSTDMN